MKVRDGNVSNSSSSSFLLIATKEAFEEAMTKVDDYEKYVAKKMQEKFGKKMGDQELVVVNEFSFDGDGVEVTNGIDEPEPQFTSKRGCKHDVKESDSFCPKCGKPRLVEEEVNPDASVSEAWYKFRSILEKSKKGVLVERRDF
jgi:hypothetical protein